MIISLERDSVCAADDCLAPHNKKLENKKIIKLSDLVNRIIEINYLPKINGGKATWVLTNNKAPVAIIAQQWKHCKYIKDPNLNLHELKNDVEIVEIYLEYLAQINPFYIYMKKKFITNR